MNDRISKAQYRRPRVRLSKCLQQQLLDALALPSSPARDDTLPQDSPVRSTKRQLDEIDQPPAKKARLANTQPAEEPSDKVRTVLHAYAIFNPNCARVRHQSSITRSLRRVPDTRPSSRDLSISLRLLVSILSTALFLSGSNLLGLTKIFAAGQIAIYIFRTIAPYPDSSRSRLRK
jgi:hypothetical protein